VVFDGHKLYQDKGKGPLLEPHKQIDQLSRESAMQQLKKDNKWSHSL
jgi:hypothetical protein